MGWRVSFSSGECRLSCKYGINAMFIKQHTSVFSTGHQTCLVDALQQFCFVLVQLHLLSIGNLIILMIIITILQNGCVHRSVVYKCLSTCMTYFCTQHWPPGWPG